MSHSQVIETIKSVQEELKGNYSTEQLMTTLDSLLYAAIGPIINCSLSLEDTLVHINSWYSTSQRRRITALTKPQFAAHVIALRVAKSRDGQRQHIFQKLQLERNLLIYMIDKWLAEAQILFDLLVATKFQLTPRIQHHIDSLRIYDLEQFPASFNSVKYYYRQALSFREKIAQKYMRLVATKAVAYSQQRGLATGARQSTSDIAQRFLLYLFKAIDKCDPTKGTLTAYVTQWIAHAQTTSNFRDETGTAFNIPSAQRGKITNFTLDITEDELSTIGDDSSDPEKICAHAALLERVRRLAKFIDPTGHGRLTLGIVEILSKKELGRLRSQEVK